MEGLERLRAELESATEKIKELKARLRELEDAEPKNFNEIWRVRDQLAYWEGRSEGLKLAIEVIK